MNAFYKKRRVWRTLKSTVKYKNPWLRIREDQVIRPDGKRGIYGVVEKPPAVFVVPFDGKNIYFVRQYRYPLKKVITELPAGVVNGRNIAQNARRELFEETGIQAKQIRMLGKYYTSAGHSTIAAYACLATGLNISTLKTSGQEGDESILGIHKIPINQLKPMIRNGKVECGISLAALELFFASEKIF